MAKKIVVPKPLQTPKPIYPGGTLQPPKFMATYYEWLFKDAKRIVKTATSAAGSVTIYTIPKDHDFYLTYACLSGHNQTANDGKISIDGEDYNASIMIVRLPKTLGQQSTSSPFPHPLIVKPGNLTLQFSNVSVASATIIGFLIPKSNLPEF